DIQIAPLLLADLVNGFVQSLDHVEAINDQLCLGTVVLDGFGVGATHITTCPLNTLSLVLTQLGVEKQVDRFTALSLPNPDDAGAIEVVYDRRKLSSFAVRNLVHSERDQAADLVTRANPCDHPVQDIRQGRTWHFENVGRCLLSHD